MPGSTFRDINLINHQSHWFEKNTIEETFSISHKVTKTRSFPKRYRVRTFTAHRRSLYPQVIDCTDRNFQSLNVAIGPWKTA